MMPYDLDKYSDEEIKAEILRLRNELNYLKAAISDRNRENTEILKELKKTQEAVGVLYKLTEKVSSSMEVIDDGISSIGRDLQESIHEEIAPVSKAVNKRADEIVEYVEHDEAIGCLGDISDRLDEMYALVEKTTGNNQILKLRKKIGTQSLISTLSLVVSVLSLGLLIFFVMSIG